MENNNIETLRTEMFDTLRKLKSKEISTDQARAIVEVGKVIVDTAKVEVDFARATGKKTGTGFIPIPEITNLPKPESSHPKLSADNGKGYTGIPRVGHG